MQLSLSLFCTHGGGRKFVSVQVALSGDQRTFPVHHKVYRHAFSSLQKVTRMERDEEKHACSHLSPFLPKAVRIKWEEKCAKLSCQTDQMCMSEWCTWTRHTHHCHCHHRWRDTCQICISALLLYSRKPPLCTLGWQFGQLTRQQFWRGLNHLINYLLTSSAHITDLWASAITTWPPCTWVVVPRSHFCSWN